MITKPRILLAGAAVLALSIASAAGAQPAPPPPGAARDHAGPDHEAFREHMQARRQERLQTLHDALSLRADQESAWQAYVDGMRPPEGREGRERVARAEGSAPMTTPERIDRMMQRMSERQAAFSRRAEDIKHFYAALSPAQQRTFDALSRMRMGGMGGGHGGFGHGGGRSERG